MSTHDPVNATSTDGGEGDCEYGLGGFDTDTKYSHFLEAPHRRQRVAELYAFIAKEASTRRQIANQTPVPYQQTRVILQLLRYYDLVDTARRGDDSRKIFYQPTTEMGADEALDALDEMTEVPRDDDGSDGDGCESFGTLVYRS